MLLFTIYSTLWFIHSILVWCCALISKYASILYCWFLFFVFLPFDLIIPNYSYPLCKQPKTAPKFLIIIQMDLMYSLVCLCMIWIRNANFRTMFIFIEVTFGYSMLVRNSLDYASHKMYNTNLFYIFFSFFI